MNEGRKPAKRAGTEAREAREAAAPWVERLARLGYAAKGAVYVLVGVLAVAVALHGGGNATGSKGALAWLDGSNWGMVVLALIALGLLGYVVWQGYRLIANPENDGAGKRIFYGITGLIYAGLCFEAGRLVFAGASGGGAGSGVRMTRAGVGGAGSGASTGGGGGAQHWSATLLSAPGGRWILVGVGVAVILYGLQQLWNSWETDLDDQLALGALSARARPWVVRVSRFGLAARGVVLGIIGGFFVVAGIQANPSEARGLNGVLDVMAGVPWLLGLVAAGLAAYGIDNFVRARYRVIRAH